MKTRTLIRGALALTALLGTSAAFASASSDGTPVAGQIKNARQITVTPQSKYFNVFSGDVLHFKLADGTDFSWKFDGNSNYVNLADIAPKGANVSPNLRVYVSTPADSDS
ncbi:MAG: CzcE family metal-binding protein [Formivibrio sp.]|nr:CzcE family metal-binding protein [Formivibrio sp.]